MTDARRQQTLAKSAADMRALHARIRAKRLEHRAKRLKSDQWPLTARIIAKLRADSDAGLGDTIHRNLDRFGAEAMQWLYKRIIGSDCGCANRQAKLNRMFPYESSRTRAS